MAKDTRLQVPPNCDLTLGMVCIEKTQPGRTVWRMHAHEKFANTAGIMQGGLVASFADSSMGASAVTFLEGRKAFVVNAELKVSFLKPVRIGSTLTCTAYVVSGGQRVSFVEADVVDDAERLVLRATSTYVYTDRD